MSVANSYAKALFEAISQGNSPQERERLVTDFQMQMGEMRKTLSSSRQVEAALIGPLTTSKEKASLIAAITKKEDLHPMLARFFYLLASKGRLGLLAEIQDEFAAAHLTAQGGIRGKLVSAEPISQEDLQGLSHAFGKKLGKTVAFQVSMDASLLAGVKVTVNGITYDGSLRAQLDQLRNRLATSMAVH